MSDQFDDIVAGLSELEGPAAIAYMADALRTTLGTIDLIAVVFAEYLSVVADVEPSAAVLREEMLGAASGASIIISTVADNIEILAQAAAGEVEA